MTRQGPTKKKKKKKTKNTRENKQGKLDKEEKEAWKINLTKLKMNHLDPEDAIFLVDAFLDECKVNNISVVEKVYELHTNYNV